MLVPQVFYPPDNDFSNRKTEIKETTPRQYSHKIRSYLNEKLKLSKNKVNSKDLAHELPESFGNPKKDL